MGLCLLWQPAILLYIIVMYYVVLVWRNKFSSSSSISDDSAHGREHKKLPTEINQITKQQQQLAYHIQKNTTVKSVKYVLISEIFLSGDRSLQEHSLYSQ